MKAAQKIFLLLSATILLFSSCSTTNFSVSKRHYRKGYNVDLGVAKKQSTPKNNEVVINNTTTQTVDISNIPAVAVEIKKENAKVTTPAVAANKSIHAKAAKRKTGKAFSLITTTVKNVGKKSVESVASVVAPKSGTTKTSSLNALGIIGVVWFIIGLLEMIIGLAAALDVLIIVGGVFFVLGLIFIIAGRDKNTGDTTTPTDNGGRFKNE